MRSNQNRRGSVFRVLYLANIALIGILVMIVIIPQICGEFLFSLGIANCVVVVPLSLIFLALNIWGFAKYHSHRRRYIAIIILLCGWFILSYFICSDFYKYLFGPL